jgi:hypothetical protein
MPNVSNPCPHSHERTRCQGLNQIEKKCNVKVKIKCAMQNELIDGLVINHSPTPLPEQEQIQILDTEEIESSSKIDLKDVSWWMSIKETCKLGVPIIAKLSKTDASP